MIHLNLLPDERRRAPARVRLVLPWRSMMVGGLGLLGIYSGWLMVANRVQARTLAAITREWETLQPQRVQLDGTRAALSALQAQAAVVRTLKAPEAQWASRLNVLTDALVADLWFTSLSYGLPEGKPPAPAPPRAKSSGRPPAVPPPASPLLTLSGTALVTTSQGASPVSRYLQRLKDHPEFSRLFRGVELKDVQHRQMAQEDVSDFVMILYPTGV